MSSRGVIFAYVHYVRARWRKAASVVPVMGAVVGGSVNAWYIYDVARVARYCFQERWLAAREPDSLRRQPPAMLQTTANDA